MTKRKENPFAPYFESSLATRIVKLFDLEPTMPNLRIAQLCGTDAEYVRVVLRRRGRKLGFKDHEARKRSGQRLPDAAP